MSTDAQRRRLLGQTLLGVATLGFGRWARAAVTVAGWPAKRFAMTVSSDVMDAASAQHAQPSSEVLVLGPHIVEDGGVVPITVQTTLANVSRITLVVPNNPLPLAAIFDLPEGTEPNISARLKLASDTDVVALVQTPKGVYRGSKFVKVTRGGCGG